MKILLRTKNRHFILAVSLRRDGSMGFVTPLANKRVIEKNQKNFFIRSAFLIRVLSALIFYTAIGLW